MYPAALLAVLTVSALAADSVVSWGEPVNGVRFGIGVTEATSDGKLRMVFENSSPVQQDLLIGGRTGIGPLYAMKFTTNVPHGPQCELTYFDGAHLVAGVAGAIVPIVKVLAPDGNYELRLPLNRLACTANGREGTLDVLLLKGHTFHASLEVSPESAKQSGSRKLWMGHVKSGELGVLK